jgi:hypothetical protein
MNYATRFSAALSQVAGKRLTYAEVNGNVSEAPTNPCRLNADGGSALRFSAPLPVPAYPLRFALLRFSDQLSRVWPAPQ